MAMKDGRSGADDPVTTLDEHELSQQDIVDLPNREAMSLIQPGLGLVEGNIVEGDIVSPQGTSSDPMEMGSDQPSNLGMPTESDPTTAA